MTTDPAAEIALRPGAPADAPACAALVNAWIDETPWFPRLHTPEDVVRYYCETVFAKNEIHVADTRPGAGIAGFLCLTPCAHVSALYVAAPHRRRGIGRALLDRAKARRPDGIALWAMQANLGARRFYARERFHEIRRTEGDNEEGLPDILLAWSPA